MLILIRGVSRLAYSNRPWHASFDLKPTHNTGKIAVELVLYICTNECLILIRGESRLVYSNNRPWYASLDIKPTYNTENGG